MRVTGVATLLVVGCAAAGQGGQSGPTDAPVASDAPGGGGDGGTAVGDACPPGQHVVDVKASGQVTCMTIDALARQAIGSHCSVYAGWRDNCGSCTTAPSKWGRASTASCSPGVGVNNTCTMPNLGGTQLHLFGLDLDGDVDDNDKFHVGMHCSTGAPASAAAPCPAGQLVDGHDGTSWTCSSVTNAVTAYVQSSCSLYFGWQDNCNGCTNPPTKWGYVSERGCQNGAGTGNTCHDSISLGGESVRLFGLLTGGNVDNNDKFHIGLHCTPATPESSMQTTSCPAGQFVTEVLPGGGFRCESIGPSVASYVRERCWLYLGWKDNCNGCITPPTKWGKVRVGECMNGTGADNTCTAFTLGGQTVTMFGLNTDGDVDENDVLYFGFYCE